MGLTWPRRRIWLLIPAASLVPALLDAGQMWLKERLDGTPGTNWGNVAFQGIEWLFLGALAPIAWYMARAFPLERAGWKRALAAHVAGALLLCAGWATLGIVLGLWLDHWVAQGPLGQAYLGWLLSSVPWSVFMYFTVLGCVYAFSYYNESRERQLQAARLREQLSESRLAALRMQLQPHFLFNSLNTVSVLVREQDNRGASRVLELLGDQLRRVLRPERPQLVRFQEEARFIGEYLEIERVRFPDRLRVDWSVEPAAHDALVPDLLLQPLVENAVRHGVAQREGPTRIEIAADVRDDVVTIHVTDTGASTAPNGPSAGGGVRLANIRERLRTLYGDTASLALDVVTGGGTRATVKLPYRTRAQ